MVVRWMRCRHRFIRRSSWRISRSTSWVILQRLNTTHIKYLLCVFRKTWVWSDSVRTWNFSTLHHYRRNPFLDLSHLNKIRWCALIFLFCIDICTFSLSTALEFNIVSLIGKSSVRSLLLISNCAEDPTLTNNCTKI